MTRFSRVCLLAAVFCDTQLGTGGMYHDSDGRDGVVQPHCV